MSEASIGSGDDQKFRKSFGNYDFATNRKEVQLLKHVKMVEVAEMEMVLLSILCDTLENREYADIITNALVVWTSAAESSISGNGVRRTKDYPQVTLSTLNILKHKAFKVENSNTIIAYLKNRMLWWKQKFQYFGIGL